jgi:glycosyltransferase involved in cell wall biosynthesis
LKVLFAIKSLNVQGGGAERVLVDIANGLVRRGHDASVLTFDAPGESFYRLDGGVRRIDIRMGPPGKPTPRANLLRALPKMRRATRSIGPDVAVGFMHSMYVPFGVALLGLGVPVVASEHIGTDHFHGRLVERFLVAATRGCFVARTVPGESIRDEFPPDLRGNVHVLPNPVNLTSFLNAGQARSHSRVMLNVGRFMAQKNQSELIDAFARLATRFPEWSLRIVGDGELKPELDSQVDRLGLWDRISFAGSIKDMPSEYAAAAFTVVASEYESFGLVAAESLAARRPVIGFAECRGTNDLITHEGNGLLASRRVDAIAGLAGAMERLMLDEGLRQRLGDAGPASVARFEMEGTVDRWEQFLAAVVPSGTWTKT